MAYIPVQNQSVSGTVGASVVGLPPVNLNVGGNPVTTSNPVAVQPPASGFLPVLNIGSIISVNQGSIGAVIIGGSIASAGVANQSVSGTVGASVVGHAPVVIVGGSVAASFTPPANQSVSGAVEVSNFPTNQNVTGSVVAFQGTPEWTVKSSLAGGVFPVSGSVAATITNTNVNVSGSVVAFGFPTTQNVSGSVVAWLQSTNASVITVGSPVANQSVSGAVSISNFPTSQNVSGSVIAFPTGQYTVVSSLAGGIFPISGSVAAVITNTVLPVSGQVSVAGTYAEDSTHTSGSNGLFVLGVRNDTLSSVTSADGDYTPMAQGPAGETIVANAPITKWVQGTTSVLNQFGASMVTIASQGASTFTYITGVQVANMGASSVLVTFSGATSSVVGYTIAPGGGGSNIVLPNAWKTNANGAFTTSVSGASSVYVSAEGFISKI